MKKRDTFWPTKRKQNQSVFCQKKKPARDTAACAGDPAGDLLISFDLPVLPAPVRTGW
jgi:hypothetical protein